MIDLVRMRMARYGRHKLPFYRLVAIDSRASRDGGYIEQFGTFEPLKGEAKITEEIAMKWLRLGAQPTETVRSLLKEKGIYARFLEEKKNASKK